MVSIYEKHIYYHILREVYGYSKHDYCNLSMPTFFWYICSSDRQISVGGTSEPHSVMLWPVWNNLWPVHWFCSSLGLVTITTYL